MPSIISLVDIFIDEILFFQFFDAGRANYQWLHLMGRIIINWKNKWVSRLNTGLWLRDLWRDDWVLTLKFEFLCLFNLDCIFRFAFLSFNLFGLIHWIVLYNGKSRLVLIWQKPIIYPIYYNNPFASHNYIKLWNSCKPITHFDIFSSHLLNFSLFVISWII